ncbi:MAG: alpha-amylase, partial [Tannerella sp.]|nr:alpha-amylase [Tannerella sp.]
MKRFLFLTVLSAFCLGAFAQQKLPAPEAVAMYEINPRVFAPKNSFRAIAARLDSIHELGINVVWFMPIYETGKLKAKGSPYCVRNYEAVNPEFGTMADFKKLVALCHQKGMSVLLDWVANHTSWDNVWMAAHKDWYTQDAKGRVISPAGTGWNDVADLNFSNRQMRLAMIRAMRFWVEKADVD